MIFTRGFAPLAAIYPLKMALPFLDLSIPNNEAKGSSCGKDLRNFGVSSPVRGPPKVYAGLQIPRFCANNEASKDRSFVNHYELWLGHRIKNISKTSPQKMAT